MALANYPNYKKCIDKNCASCSYQKNKNNDICVEIDRRKIFKLSENSREFILDNDCQKKITKVKVDNQDDLGKNCLGIQGKKCDYLLIIDEDSSYIEIFVELKGTKVLDGIKQIEETVKKLSKNYRDAKKYCYVVAANINPKTNLKRNIAIKKFKNSYSAILEFKSGQYKKKLSKLI